MQTQRIVLSKRQVGLLLWPMFLGLASCSALVVKEWNEKFGEPVITRYAVPLAPQANQVQYRTVARVFESRCTVCHSCYDAPCQLKLTAWEGVARGSSPKLVYDSFRWHSMTPTRLFEDAADSSEWRSRSFHAVLNERSGQDNINGSVLAQMLLLKSQNPNPVSKTLPDTFDFSLDRVQQCSEIETFSNFSQKNPLWGMPFGLPGLSVPETTTLLDWIKQGAPREKKSQLNPGIAKQVEETELWLNRDSFKARLVSRYIYEHLFLAHLHFDDDLTFFNLVRSRTPPGLPIDRISSRRPYDDPGVNRPYYRLSPTQESIVVKTHMPYRLDARKRLIWRKLFDQEPFTVTSLPSYDSLNSANPFLTYVDIPISSRYRFLLEEAQFTIMGFIKGPVCRGQLALNVIDDFFWVFFVDPNLINEGEDAKFLAANGENLRLPAELESDPPLLSHWKVYAEREQKYLKARADYYLKKSELRGPLGSKIIWNGLDEDSKPNNNAALTVFRHLDNASVEQGLIGNQPQSAWIIGYPLLERIHYLLVAGYDVFGNTGHQLRSRLFMDFLRIEGEQNFLSLLPTEDRRSIENKWYRDAPSSTMEFVRAAHLQSAVGTHALNGQSPESAYHQLLSLLKARMGSSLSTKFELDSSLNHATHAALVDFGRLQGPFLQWLPQNVFIQLVSKDSKPKWFSLINNSAHKNVAEIFFEDSRRLPDEDTLTLVQGFIGSYPNSFWRVREQELPALIQQIQTLKGEKDYSALLDNFGIRRTNIGFWQVSDAAHSAMEDQDRIKFGIFDYNRLENR